MFINKSDNLMYISSLYQMHIEYLFCWLI